MSSAFCLYALLFSSVFVLLFKSWNGKKSNRTEPTKIFKTKHVSFSISTDHLMGGTYGYGWKKQHYFHTNNERKRKIEVKNTILLRTQMNKIIRWEIEKMRKHSNEQCWKYNGNWIKLHIEEINCFKSWKRNGHEWKEWSFWWNVFKSQGNTVSMSSLEYTQIKHNRFFFFLF